MLKQNIVHLLLANGVFCFFNAVYLPGERIAPFPG